MIHVYYRELRFLIWGVHALLGSRGLAVGQLAVIRANERTPPRCIISRPANPQWKSKAGTQEMGVE